MKTHRVVFIEQDSQLGGVEMTTLITASRLDHSRYSPLVICPTTGELVSRLERAGVPIKILPRPPFFSITTRLGRRLVPNPLAIFATLCSLVRTINPTRRLLISEQAQLVVTKGLLAHLYGGAAAARAGIPCIWHVQEVINASSLGGLYLKVFNVAARRWANLILVDSSALKDQFLSSIRSGCRVRVLYNGIDTKKFAPNGPVARFDWLPAGPNKPLIIGHVGRIVPLKGQRILLEAFNKIAKEFPLMHLVFAGVPLFDTDHYLIDLQQRTSELGLIDRVHFIGFVDRVPDLLRLFDLFIHPSIEADSPLSVLEAMAVGLPVIASAVPGTTDLFKDGKEGLLVPPSDIKALANKITDLLQNPSERSRLGHSARAAAIKRYDQDVYIRSLECLMDEVLGL